MPAGSTLDRRSCLPRRCVVLLRPILLAVWFAAAAGAQASFEQKLTGDQRIQHALNRLTFGARPGDLEEVRRIGLEKWIQAQLHPETIAESATLEAKLKPLETLRLDTATIVKDYPVTTMRPIVRPSPNMLIGPENYNKLLRGTLEERLAILKPLDPVKRRQVLAALAPANFSAFPELQKEAEIARLEDQKGRQAGVGARMG